MALASVLALDCIRSMGLTLVDLSVGLTLVDFVILA
jgi:hypothetical protein